MQKAVRWILVLPAAVGAAILAYIALTLLWNAVRIINIVPQDGLVDLALASAGINGFASAAGVAAGARVAPHGSHRAAVVLGAVFVLAAVVTLDLGYTFRAHLAMSFGWHVFSSLAWSAGAVVSAYVLAKAKPGPDARPK